MDSTWLYDALKDMPSSLEDAVSLEQCEEVDVVCSNCKTRRSDFLETGFIGCSECYKLFANDIRPMVQNYHGESEHVGKVPERVVNESVTLMEIERLTKLKEDAIACDDFLSANDYHQKIKTLRGEL